MPGGIVGRGPEAGGKMTIPPICDCGHIAYWHTELVGSQMVGVTCWHDGCRCPEYQPNKRY